MDPALINENIQMNRDLEDLPKEIVGEIISILPIKDAVRTSVLSKQWQHRWKGMSNINLIEDEYESREQFIDVVDKLFTFCSSSLKKFSLTCDVDYDSAKMNQWLNVFIKLGIEELDIHLDNTSTQLVFPQHLFNSRSLTHLELEMAHTLILPPFIHFPSLKVLKLIDVLFSGTTQTQNFFSGLPSLEKLSLISCIWYNVDSFRIDSPSLHSFHIEEWEVFEDLNPLPYSQIEINGNNKLKTFSYYGRAVNKYALSSTSSVNSAVLDFHPQQENNALDPGQLVFNFLVAFSNVQTLTINACAIADLCHSSHLARMTPMFCKLDELIVESDTGPMNLARNAMQIILRHAPILRSLRFSKGVVLPEDIDRAPACFENHIKSIAIENFGGTDEEKAAVKILLKWAKVVSEFNLFIEVPAETDEDLNNLQELMDEIVEYPKSDTCDLYFCLKI